jgi:thymidylate synthase ThyX
VDSSDIIHLQEVDKMRQLMGTASKKVGENKTRFVRGGEDIVVDMIAPRPLTNFYLGMYSMAVSTWGGVDDSSLDKWNDAPVEARMRVVQAILQRKALPLALEHPQFLFEIRGCSRSAFDQIARARIGTTISSMGVRDNAHPDIDIVTPPKVYDDPDSFLIFKEGVLKVKETYKALLDQGQRSWQDARAVLPMGMKHRFCLNINYAALQGMLGKRLQFCEQYDTVAVAWKIRQELSKHYALLGEALRPSCDFARRCTYHEANSVGEEFGCLFAGCGRWPDPYEYAEFNEAAADVKDIEEWMHESVPKGEDPIDWDAAAERDRHWFEGEVYADE